MNLDNQKLKESTVDNETKVRRTFLKRVSAGAVIASIPAKSVWANGITASIVASGHGSDFNNGKCTGLLSPEFFKGSGNVDVWSVMHDNFFTSIFGGAPISTPGFTYDDYSLIDVISNPGGDGAHSPSGINNGNLKLGGSYNVNFMLVGMYLNSVFHGQYGIEYPIASVSFGGDPTAFAKHIYAEALSDTAGMANLMSAMIHQFHVGDESLEDLPSISGNPLDGYYSGVCS
ncbi:MAG: hypothetical protein ACI9O4_002478 [Chitinophagales bacterium]|jgi:hypothetical protein